MNGNGRWSRMLANIRLALPHRSPIAWPEAAIGDVSPIRDEYLAALRAADRGDLDPLIDLHRRHADD